MKTGYFDDKRNTYVIENMFPRRPLINYIWNEEYIMGVDHTGQGKGFGSVGEGLRRDLFLPDCDNRLVYIKDEETGECWCFNKPFRRGKLDEYRCETGVGVQTIYGTYKEIQGKFSMTVPEAGKAELWQLKFKNVGEQSRKLSVYVYAKVHVLETFHSSYNISDWNEQVGGFYFSHKIYGAQHPYSGIYVCADRDAVSFCTSDTRFRGMYQTYENPIGVETDTLDNKGSSYDDYPSATMQFRFELEQNQTETINLVVGLATCVDEAAEDARTYLQEGTFEGVVQARKETSAEVERIYLLESGDAYIDRLTNVWLKNQVQLGKTWARVYGKGVRDMLQDITAFVSMDGDLAKTKIKQCLSYQFGDGNTVRMFAPFLRHPYVDGAAWIPETVVTYMKETGDIEFLDEVVPFFECDESGTVLEHIRRGIGFLTGQLGSHGLCLWGGGDWNDSIDNAGMQGIGESVWLSIATVKACKHYQEILKYIGRTEEAKIVKEKADRMTDNIIKHGFEGGHFIYGITDWGEKVGSDDCEEGKIYLNPQSWAVLAGIFDEADSNKLMDVVEERLHCDYGYVQCAPSYTKLDNHIGRSTGFLPGCVENGSVYNHGVTFKIAADCKLGRAEQAYRSVKEILPNNPVLEGCGVEPYAVTNMYLGPENPYDAKFAPCSWITGTAGWLYRCITEFIFGISAEYEGLKVAPCLPQELDNVTIRRKFRGAVYNIHIQRGENARIACDGVELSSNIVPIFEKGTTHEVEVYLG